MTSEGLLFTSLCGTGAADSPRRFSLIPRLSVPPILVGYNSMETVEADLTWAVTSFEGVSGDAATFKLGQISVGDQDFAWWNNDYVATIASSGAQDQYYTWDPDTSSWYECDETETIDYDAPANDKVLPTNAALFFYSINGIQMTHSGAVMAGDTELYGVPADLTFTGNFTPATITLGDIVVGEEDFAWWNNDYIATIASSGAQDQYYTWDPDTSSWYECDETETIDYDAPANDVEIPANTAFIYYSVNGAVLNIPSPL